MQPFVAVGDYSDLRKLALPYSYLFSPVTISYDPDFNTKSLRGNVVLRWEYVRGSTLFVVWDLSQADYSRPGVFRPWSDIGTAFGAEATHTLMVKVSYWINQYARARARASRCGSVFARLGARWAHQRRHQSRSLPPRRA